MSDVIWADAKRPTMPDDWAQDGNAFWILGKASKAQNRAGSAGAVMDQIIILEGTELREFLEMLNDSGHTYRLRLAIDGGGIKVKRNEGTWTLPFGAVDEDVRAEDED